MLPSLLLIGCVALLVPADCAVERSCVSVPQSTCSRFFHGVEADPSAGTPAQTPLRWPSTFPNARNLDLLGALREFSHFIRLLRLDNYCSYLLHSFLCMHYFPPCDPSATSHPMVVPCRELCEVAMDECLIDYVLDYYCISRPQHLNCTTFPERGDPCDMEQMEFIIACPDPALHFEFSLPFAEEELKASEVNDSLEVCVKIASTGNHDSLPSLVTVDLVFEDISAKGGEDYYVGSCNQLEFGVGRVKGHRECCDIKIVDDYLVEGKEEFLIHAHVHAKEDLTSGKNGSAGGNRSKEGDSGDKGGYSSVVTGGGSNSEGKNEVGIMIFGGSLKSSRGSVSISISDNDAADIEVLDVTNCTGCTCINVHILECWELERGHCQNVGEKLTIPTCTECPRADLLSTGNRFLIAGVWQSSEGEGRMVLPNKRQMGLFSPWKVEYADVGGWIQLALNMTRW